MQPLPPELEDSEHAYVLESVNPVNGNSIRKVFFAYPNKSHVYLTVYYNNKRQEEAVDMVTVNRVDVEVPFNHWLSIGIARAYWYALVEDRGFKRVK